MEEIFIQALAERSKMEAGLLSQLPEDVKALVLEKLTEEELKELGYENTPANTEQLD